ncbi:VC0807 family protein [Kitasatospora sp. NPDC048540]|uniref:VC0807 family protein n=1 Tax=unclassified Kitasatospora TaxID=2633591 RepID=UPI00068E0148|nr:VC0807 family protein [Kitasatospora sp. MBT63]
MATITTSTDIRRKAGSGALAALRPLAVDIAVPLGAYYTAHAVFGLGLVASLAISSAVPVVRTVGALVRDRSVNSLALLMLLVNVAGLALSTLAGDPRLMLAKDGAVSSVIGGSMIVTALLGRPLMTAGLRPFIVKGDAARSAAWDRLLATSAAFRRNERNFSLAWGSLLVAECVAKVVGAYTVPLETMVWLSTVMLVGAIGLGVLVGNVFAGRMAEQVIAEAGAEAR